jgi:tryptophan-rich sensory protein
MFKNYVGYKFGFGSPADYTKILIFTAIFLVAVNLTSYILWKKKKDGKKSTVQKVLLVISVLTVAFFLYILFKMNN